MSMINKEIDDFTVQAFHNDDFETVTKDDVLGKWSVFFFYPADFTFVCPTELEDLGALYDKFQEANCEIYAVSCDTHFAHKAWHDASENIKKLPYPMLADPTHKLADIFDVYIEEEGVAERGSFVVKPRGQDRVLRGECRQHRPQRRRAAAPRAGQPVRGRARRLRVPRALGAGLRGAPSGHRPGGQAVSLHRPRIIARAEPIGARSPAGSGVFALTFLRREQLAEFRLSAACARIPRAQAGTRWR